MVMPPVRVPVLLKMRLLAISRLCAQPCAKIPPPPCELLVMDKPSMLDGLHLKLLGYGFAPLTRQSAIVSSTVGTGNWPSCAIEDPAAVSWPAPKMSSPGGY